MIIRNFVCQNVADGKCSSEGKGPQKTGGQGRSEGKGPFLHLCDVMFVHLYCSNTYM